jgi:hypothetical protein
MTFDVEVILKETDRVITRRVEHHGNVPPDWTEADVGAVLRAILLAIDIVRHPEGPPADERPVFLRGFSWIVEPYEGQVLIMVEIPTGAAVAGPFAIARERLDQLITGAVREPGASTRVH